MNKAYKWMKPVIVSLNPNNQFSLPLQLISQLWYKNQLQPQSMDSFPSLSKRINIYPKVESKVEIKQLVKFKIKRWVIKYLNLFLINKAKINQWMVVWKWFKRKEINQVKWFHKQENFIKVNNK